MKKIFTLLSLATFCASTCMAQFNGDGYYRIQNAKSKRYAKVVDNHATNKNVSGTSQIYLKAINTVEGFSNVASDPSTIVYIEKGDANNGYSMKAMGMDTYKLAEQYLKIVSSTTTSGAYQFYGTYSGVKKDLYEAYDSSYDFYYMSTATSKTYSKDWNILPVTQAEGQYLGIKPDLTIDGKYYTTLYTSFPYQLPSGMKAYYVTDYRVGNSMETQIAELKEVPDGIVPAKSPVIIECTSNNPANNKVTLLMTEPSRNLKNILNGVFFCNVIKMIGFDDLETEHPNWNTTAYDPNTMRVLGKVNGKLGLVKATNMQFLPACKAYLTVPSNATGKAGTGEIELLDENAFAVAGIQDITTDTHQQKQGVYTLTGVKLQNATSTEDLPAGVYIVNGKKIAVK